MTKFTLQAQKRDLFGKKLNKIRKQGILPANLFGKQVDSTSIQFNLKDFDRVYKEAGETSVVYVSVDGENKERPVLISNIHMNPVTDAKLHVDLHQVNLKEKVIANVPVEITGESEHIKLGTAVLNTLINEIEVEALPTDIPENITFDISALKEIGDSLKVSDAKIPSGVLLKTDPEQIVVSLSEPQKEEEAPTPVEVAVEGEPTKVAGEESVTGTEKTPEAGAPKGE